MSGQEVLNQDEIDALLNGVDAGAVNTEPEAAPGEARQYDFSREMRIVRGRMPTLEMVNERFARQLRVSLRLHLRGLDLGLRLHHLRVGRLLLALLLLLLVLTAGAQHRVGESAHLTKLGV